MVKYKYALNSTNKIINISELSSTKTEQEKSYKCLSCNGKLIARTGKIKNWHFAHKLEENCSPETYLHILGKNIFYNNYLNCVKNKIPFYLKLFTYVEVNKFENKINKVFIRKDLEAFNLVDYFDEIKLEKRDHNFIPDLLLTNSKGDKIYVEIAVSHKCEQNKIDSKIRIIEITLEDETDIDFDNNFISENDVKTQLYNFILKPIIKNNDPIIHEIKFAWFVIFKSGKCAIIDLTLNGFLAFLNIKKSFIQYFNFSGIETDSRVIGSRMFYGNLIIALRNGTKIRSCLVCRYQAPSYSGRMYCKFLRKDCSSSDAILCNYYKFEKSYIDIRDDDPFEYLSKKYYDCDYNLHLTKDELME